MKKLFIALIAFIATVQARGVQAQVMYASPEYITKDSTPIYFIGISVLVFVFAVIGLISTIIFIINKISKKNKRQIEQNLDQSSKLPPQQDTTNTQK